MAIDAASESRRKSIEWGLSIAGGVAVFVTLCLIIADGPCWFTDPGDSKKTQGQMAIHPEGQAHLPYCWDVARHAESRLELHYFDNGIGVNGLHTTTQQIVILDRNA